LSEKRCHHYRAQTNMGKDGKGVSRRELFTWWRRPSAADEFLQPAPTAPPTWQPLRPPGAVDESRFADVCVRCGHCVAACPADAIFPLGPVDATSPRLVGTPAIRPREQACVLCTGLLCTHSCPSGALSPLSSNFQVAMGTARVDERRCLTFHGQKCDACWRACPIAGAITLDAAGAVRVDSQKCVGCGLCEAVCPTEPTSIRVIPRA
jgi:ferredoxin-type protein NapG